MTALFAGSVEREIPLGSLFDVQTATRNFPLLAHAEVQKRMARGTAKTKSIGRGPSIKLADVTNNVAASSITLVDPATVLFCPAGPPGSIPSLQDAVNVVSPGGTVLVCDGVHEVDSVAVNKPLTLRSENDGGATLRDNPAAPPGPQGGRPAIASRSAA